MADTLDKKELKILAEKIVELEGRKPKSITKIIFKPRDVIKRTDSIVFSRDSISVLDYYPSKLNPFIEYRNKISFVDSVGQSSFKLNPLKIDIVISQRDDVFEADIKTPDFIDLLDVTIQSEPAKETPKDNFGVLLGMDYRADNSVGLDGYLRWKKIYVGAGIDTREVWKTGLKVEF